MIKKGFDLYFAGSQNDLAERYLQSNGCYRLCSQFMDRKRIKEWIESGATGKLFIDSGAFSAHTRGVELDVDEYIYYVNGIDEHVSLVAQLDTIPGVYRQTKTREQLELAPMQSWANYLYMRERMISPEKLLPIFHQGEDYKWLENMLEATFDGKHIPYIGLSPANDVSVKEKERFIEHCFKIIRKSSNPEVKTHAFGLTAMNLLERYPITSADSTRWIMDAACGGILTKFGSVAISDGRLDAPNHYRRMQPLAQEEVRKYVEGHGYTIQGLATDYKDRVNFNIMFMYEWSKNYIYSPSSIRRMKLF